MDEEKKEEDKKEEEPEEETKKDTEQLLDRSEAVVKELDRVNKEKKELLDREEVLQKKAALGGKSEGAVKEEKKPETDEEYADKVMKGEANPLKEDGYM